MKIEQLLTKLEEIRLETETDFDPLLTATEVVNVLIDFIGNKKVEDKINEIPF